MGDKALTKLFRNLSDVPGLEGHCLVWVCLKLTS